jgi:sulfur carrier protein
VVAPGSTLEDLVASLGLTRKRVAVAVNREVVPSRTFAARRLADGDRIEILEAVGGG